MTNSEKAFNLIKKSDIIKLDDYWLQFFDFNVNFDEWADLDKNQIILQLWF